ncbi:MAG: hypothetical protein GXY76_19875 [Chloroflexi bacterium]|nr:hypothetical protein [Chloroflexota bacterium]
MPERPARVIRASEVGEYLFCATSWWLHRVRGLAPANLEDLAAGRAAHAAHGWGSVGARAAGWLGWLLLAAALVAAAALWISYRGG